MNVKQLTEELKKLPENLPIKVVDPTLYNEENKWVYNIEVSNTNDSGYELSGEVRLLISK